MLVKILTIFFLIAIALASDPFPNNTVTGFYRFADGHVAQWPFVFAQNNTFEPLLACPKSILTQYIHPNYTLATDWINPNYGLVQMIVLNYPKSYSQHPDIITTVNEYEEFSIAILLESPDQNFYPCSAPPESYCPMDYIGKGYRSASFWDDNPDGRPAEYKVYTEIFHFDEALSRVGEFEFKYIDNDPHKPDIYVYETVGHSRHLVFHLRFDYTGIPVDDGMPLYGFFHQFGGSPIWQNYLGSFYVTEQVTYYWGTGPHGDQDLIYFNPHTITGFLSACEPRAVIFQKPDSPNYVWNFQEMTNNLPVSTCGGICQSNIQCPTSCSHCTNHICQN